MLWLKRLMDEIDFKQDRYFVHYDSESIIYMNKNLIFYSNKHIDVRYHYVRDVLDVWSLELANPYRQECFRHGNQGSDQG